MTWTTTSDPDAFRTGAGGFLDSSPELNTMLLSALATAGNQASTTDETTALFGWWQPEAGGPVEGAFAWTPPNLIALSPVPAAAQESLAALFAADSRGAVALIACEQVASAFAAAWTALTSRRTAIALRTRLYRLGELAALESPVGQARVATSADRDLLLKWCADFTRETGDPAGDLETFVDDRLSYPGLLLWEADGVPVAMAGITRAASGMARITSVYTLPGERRKGYAAAATSAISAAARRAGTAEVLLFADLDNPASNSLYEKIGFSMVEDFLLITLNGPA